MAFVGIDKNNSKEEFDFSEYFHAYLYNISGGITQKEIDTQIEQIEDKSKKQTIYNYFDELRKEGREIGIELGREQEQKISIYANNGLCHRHSFGESTGRCAILVENREKSP